MSNEDLKGRYLSVVQVANMLNVSKKTIYHMRKTGYLPGFKLGGRVLIDRLELQERLQELKEKCAEQSAKNSTRKEVD